MPRFIAQKPRDGAELESNSALSVLIPNLLLSFESFSFDPAPNSHVTLRLLSAPIIGISPVARPSASTQPPRRAPASPPDAARQTTHLATHPASRHVTSLH